MSRRWMTWKTFARWRSGAVNHTLLLALCSLIACTASVLPAADDIAEQFTKARRRFIPAESLEVILQRDGRGVLMAREQFETLLKRARENLAQNPVPDVPVALTAAQYDCRIVGDQLLITVTADVHQFATGWQSLTLPLQRLAIEQALWNDEPALLGRNADGSVAVLNAQRGKHVLKLELSTELASLGSDQAAAFSLLKAPTGALTLTLPAGKRLLIGALQVERPAPVDQPADYRISVGGATGIQLRITDRAQDNAADALTFASTGYGVHVAPGEVTWHALTTLQVFGKPVDRLTFSVPSTLEIAEVDSSGLERWELQDDPAGEGKTVLTLTFGQSFDGTRKISLKGVMAVETGTPWAIPPLTIANVTSHIGQVLVQHPAGVRLRVEETQGVRRATHDQKPTADMPDEMARLNATEFLRFDVWQPDFLLRLTTQPKQREVQAAVATVLDVNATGLDLQALVSLKTQFAPLFEVDVRIPADWTVISAHRDQTPLTWQVLAQEAGINQLRILPDAPLAPDASATIRLTLRRDVEGWPVELTPIVVALPELYLPQASLSEGTLVIRGDDDLELAAFDLQGLDTVPLKADFERLRFQSQDTRYGGKLKVTRKPSRISVQTTTFSRLDPQTTHTLLQAVVEVQGGGVQTLRVALPEAAGTGLRFQADGRQIVEQKPGPVQNGERIWTLQFDQRLRGLAPLSCDLELPRGAGAFLVPQLRFPDAERQNGYLAIEAGAEQRLTIDARGADDQPLAEVDPLNLPVTGYEPKERIVAVYQNVAAGAKLTLAEERFDKLAVPTAICPLLTVTSILGQTGELQHRAEFQLHAVGVQGLRITLPTGTQLWATLIDGQPVEVRRQGDIYLVPFTTVTAVPSAAAPAGTRNLKLFYRSEVAALTRFGTIEQTPPELAAQTGSGVSQPVDVLDQRWNLHYPSKTMLVDSHGTLEPEQRLDSTGLLGRMKTGVRIPTLEQLSVQAFFVIVTLGAIALVLLAYRSGRLLRLFVVGLGAAVVIGGFLLMLGLMQMQLGQPHAMAPKMAPVAAWEDSFHGEVAATAAPRSEPMPTPPMTPTSEAPGAMDEMKSLKDEERPAEGDRALPMPADKPGDPFPVAQNDGVPPAMQPGEKPVPQAADPRFGVPQRPVPEPVPAKSEVGDATKLALLSLAMDLTPPDGSLQKSFRYVGAEPTRSLVALKLDYLDEHSGTVARVALVALIVLIGWMLRSARCRVKLSLAALGLTLPLGLLPVVPDLFQVVVDGVFFGTLIVCGLWLFTGCVRCVLGWTCCGWNRPQTVVPMALLSLLILNSSAQAQPAQQAVDAPNGAPNQAAVAQPVAPGNQPLTLIVPTDTTDQIVIPYEKFLELYQRAYPDRALPGEAPLRSGVVQALYRARIVPNEQSPDDSVAEITARFAIRSDVRGQTAVELPLGAVAWRSAQLDGKSAPLIVQGACTKVAINAPGLHVIDAVFSVPARLSGTTGSVLISFQPVLSGRLTVELPAPDLAVRINGSTTVYRRVVEGEQARIEVPVDKGGDMTVTWQPEQARGAAAAVVHVDSVQAVILGDAGVRISSGLRYRVRQGSVADVSLLLPQSLRLQSVAGPDVGGWELQGEGDDRKLRVIFRRNVTDTTQFTIDAYLDSRVGTEAAVIAVPQVSPQEITNEIGQVAVFAGDQFTLRAETVDGLAQIDSDKFSTTVPFSRPAHAPQLAYRFSKRPYTLTLRAARQESQAAVVAQQAAFVTIRKQLLTTRLRYNLTGAPRSAFQIALPAGFVVLDLQATGLQDWSVGPGDGARTLTIDLKGPRLGAAEVVLTGTTPRDQAERTAKLEFPRPLDATRLQSTAAVWLDDGYSGTLDTFENWRSIDSGTVNGDLRAIRPDKAIQFAFQSAAREPSAITLRLDRASPRLDANGLAMVSVTDVAVIHTLALQWTIQGATTDSLVFTTPSFLAGKLEFSGAGIRETTFVDAGNGRTRWTIWLRTPVSGKYFVGAIGTMPPPGAEIEAPAIVFEQGEGAPGVALEGQRQYVLLINLSQSQLTSATPELTESVSRDDVPVVVDQSLVDQATEFVRIKQQLATPRWTRQTFAQQAGAPASVNVADVTTLLSRDGTYRGQAIYTIKNRSRQFLALRLPENAELLSVFVGPVPSRAVTTTRNNLTYQLVALPKTSVASLAFPVRIIWRGRIPTTLPKSARLMGQEVDLPVPQVVSQQDDPDFGIPVARTRWTVWLPDDLDALPLRDSTRQNMGLLESGQKDLLYERAAMQELSELLGYVAQNYDYKSSSDQSRRSQLRNNMRQIGLALHNLDQLEQAVQGVDGDGEFREQRDGALRSLSELKKSVEQDANGNGIADNAGLAIQQFGNDTQVIISGNGLGANAQPILSNTSTLYNANAPGVTNPQQQAGDNFMFELQLTESAPETAKPASKAGGKEIDDKKGYAQSEARQKLRRDNDGNLEALNEGINRQKSAEQRGRAGRQLQLQQQMQMQNGTLPQGQASPNAYGLWANPIVDGAGPGQMPGASAPQFNNGFLANGGFNRGDQSGNVASGGMGGMGGGMGGMGPGNNNVEFWRQLDEFAPNGPIGRPQVAQGGAVAANPVGTAVPPAARGLSLEFELPTSGKKLVFSKAGGDPRLALSVRPRESIRWGLNLAWSSVWLALGAVIVITANSAAMGARFARQLPLVLAILGVVGFVLLPGPIAILSFAVFVVASIAVAWINRRNGMPAHEA